MAKMLKALGGGYTIALEEFSEDEDAASAFKGLPDDRCQCPHWGYVVTGKIGYRYAGGREETYLAGDAYYVAPGHTPVLYEGSEVVEFSPSDELERTIQVVRRNTKGATEGS